MPRYRYTCERCNVEGLPREIEEQRKVAEREPGPECPECHQPMKLAPAVTSPTFPGAASWRG